MINPRPLSIEAIDALSDGERTAWIASFFAWNVAQQYMPRLELGIVALWYREIDGLYVPWQFVDRDTKSDGERR